MNSRECILTTLNHKEPDRVPIDIGASQVTGISAIAYYNLKKHLGIQEGYVRIIDVFQQLARVEDWFIERFGIDAIDIGSQFMTNDSDWYDVEVNGIKAQFPATFKPQHNPDDSYELVHPDGTVLARMSKAAVVMDQMYVPFKEGYPEELNFQSLLKAIDKLGYTRNPNPPMTLMPTRKFWKEFREKALYLREHTDKIIVFQPTLTVFQAIHAFRGLDKTLVDVIRKPKIIEKFVSLLLEFYISSLKPITKYIGDVVDIIVLGDDLGENNGPMINPRLYRKHIKYAHEEICSYIKKNSKMKVFFHSCGSIVPLIPDLIECGFDILNPIQINARNMDPKFLKENFGYDIVFWGGGVDTREIPRLGPEQVKKHVTELLEIFAPGGGYVWNPIHNLQADVPPENILAMLEAVNEYSYEN